MQQSNPSNNRMGKFTGGCMKAVAAVLFCILFYLFLHGFFVTDQADFLQGNLGKVSRFLTVFLAFAFVGSLISLIQKGLRMLSEKQLKGVMVAAFFCMVALQIFCLCTFGSMYLWDGAFVVGGANSLLETGEISQDAFYYLSVYKNQHPFVVVTAFFLWIGKMLSLSTGGQYLLLNFLNVFCMDSSIVFLVKMVGYLLQNREMKNRLRAQCGLVLLFVLNPFVYVLAGYYYTIFLSLPFFTGGMYFACKALRGEKRVIVQNSGSTRVFRRKIPNYARKNPITAGDFKWIFTRNCERSEQLQKRYVILAGLMFAGGYALRATTIIPVIACVITALLVAVIKTDVKQFGYGLGIAVVAIVIGMGFCSVSEKVVGIDTTDTAFPTTHWIMMSLTSPGCHNEEDEAFTASFPTKEAKQQAVKERLAEKVQALGFSGMAKLMLDKVNYTWESGNHAYSFFAGNCVGTEGLYDAVYGTKKDLLALYGQGFYLVLIGCSLLTILKSFFANKEEERKTRCLMFFICLTLLGGFLFYLLWETGTQYSLVFFPIFFLLADFVLFAGEEEGVERLLTTDGEANEYLPKAERIHRLKMAAGLLVFLLFICLWWKNRTVFTSQTYSNTDTVAIQLLANTPYEVKENEVFVQELAPCREFNQLIFQFRNFVSEEENDSVYCVKLYRMELDEQVLVWEDSIIAKGQPQNGAFIKEFETLPAGEYQLEIQKTAGSTGNTLSFVTYEMGGYDAYTKGKCLVNAQEQPRDLMFGMYLKGENTYTTMSSYILLGLVFFIYFLFWEICCILRR